MLSRLTCISAILFQSTITAFCHHYTAIILPLNPLNQELQTNFLFVIVQSLLFPDLLTLKKEIPMVLN